jgi:serine/threonine protein kinase
MKSASSSARADWRGVPRPRDSRLNPTSRSRSFPTSSRDPERLARFKREAHVLAALNPPDIAAIDGFEESGSTQALVMEPVDGATLADRVLQGPLPLDEAVPSSSRSAPGGSSCADYSVRSARIGSIRAARRAGM